MKTRSLLPIACGALLAAFSLAAVAQDAPKKTLTRDELRACLDNQDTLKARGETIKQRTAKLQEESDAIKAEDDQLRQEQKRAEESSMPGVRDRFERKVRQHTSRIKAAEEEGKAVRADADAFTKDLDAHNGKCSNVAVSRDDREAVMKEREAAGKK
jgi:hypothetical protein